MFLETPVRLKVLVLGCVSSPLCVYELGLVCSQTQLCHMGVFIDCVEQLHVSAFVGHHQVVLRELNILALSTCFMYALRASPCRDLYITGFILYTQLRLTF